MLDDDKLTEALNCEIAQGIITSEQEATDWVMSTFLFRRIQAHPLFYGLNGNGQDAARSFAAEKSKNAVDQLRRIGAVSMNEDGTFSYSVASSVSRSWIVSVSLIDTLFLMCFFALDVLSIDYESQLLGLANS